MSINTVGKYDIRSITQRPQKMPAIVFLRILRFEKKNVLLKNKKRYIDLGV